ncbi:MAG: 2-amino-4-hydroxy-6-hydroxymethyldihydropteridine diphosphokinase, partial [Sedimentisphaerales bacterium]|nr:2-amino-4-hydroxy-6-hydroxymethyldihydropteridine diphosphokinase [Sedimentisphaerales bacterium]
MNSNNSQPSTLHPATAYIALGSNLGNRSENISEALHLLDTIPEITIVKVSSLIETAPAGGPKGQNNYINGVVEILSRISAEQLLELMQSVETRLGRPAQQNRPKWSPRTIDLDLLLFGSEIIDTPLLMVPHPLMHQRRFVMAPLVELAPDLTHPVLGRSMRKILDSLTPLIAIAGVIGVGKTTLATKLAHLLNAQLILEEYDKNP